MLGVSVACVEGRRRCVPSECQTTGGRGVRAEDCCSKCDGPSRCRARCGYVVCCGERRKCPGDQLERLGPGSFRAAISKANADPSLGRIVFRPGLAPIMLADPVVYQGGQSLEILGNGAVVNGGGLDPGAPDAFLANGGGDLSVTLLTIRNAPQQGLRYEVPDGATGTKEVILVGVKILGNGGHGVLINDQDFPERAGGPDAELPVAPNPAGSAASLGVWVIGSQIGSDRAGNGFGAPDQDGLRVNEGGLGNLNAVISLTQVEGNGGDGIELDERGDGDAEFNVSGSRITKNGSFDLTVGPDDGMDVNESGNGAVIGKALASSANENLEEGWDLNENDAGDFEVDMTFVEASRNREEGIDFEEDDDFAGGGDLITNLTGIKTDANTAGDAGLKIREKGDGNLNAIVRSAQAEGNQGDGIQVREDAAGNLTATIDRSVAGGNTGDGIEFEENSTGDITATVDRSTTNSNAKDGIEFDDERSRRTAGLARVANASISSRSFSGQNRTLRKPRNPRGVGRRRDPQPLLTGRVGATAAAHASRYHFSAERCSTGRPQRDFGSSSGAMLHAAGAAARGRGDHEPPGSRRHNDKACNRALAVSTRFRISRCFLRRTRPDRAARSSPSSACRSGGGCRRGRAGRSRFHMSARSAPR